MNSNKKPNYESKILKKLTDSPSGLTITEISEKTRIHRNTVSKYLNMLEAKGLVKKKRIGVARLYFSKKRKYLRKELVNNFLRAFLASLNESFPNKNEIFKEIGRNIVNNFEFPVGDAYIDEFKKISTISDPQSQLKLFQDFYNSYDFFQEDIDISIRELRENTIVYRLTNSEFLNKENDYHYFYYIVCGITEMIYKKNLNLDVICNIKKFKIGKKEKNSYIDLSLQIQND